MARPKSAVASHPLRRRHAGIARAIFAGIAALAANAALGEIFAGEPSETAAARTSALRGLSLVTRDGSAWMREQGCASCHHGPMMLWTLGWARQHGLPVDVEALYQMRGAALNSYLDTDFVPTPGLDTAPLSLGALYVVLGATAGGEIAPVEPLGRFGDHLRETQLPDGSWAAPDLMEKDEKSGRDPPLLDSREVTTGWAALALASLQVPESAASDSAIDKSLEWLSTHHSATDTQAAVVRLLIALRFLNQQQVNGRVRELLVRQRADGGWGQTPSAPSDAFASGQALYALGNAGVGERNPAIGRAWRYLIQTQRDSGGWVVISRSSDHDASAVGYAGSAWAVIGLLSTVPAKD